MKKKCGYKKCKHDGIVNTDSDDCVEENGKYYHRDCLREKNAIAEFCAGLIKEGNAIYLDTGSTNIEIAEELKNRQNIAVLSHSLPIHNILSANDKLQLIAMPGFYRSSPHGFFGDLTCRMIKNFRIDIAFLGISSIDASGIMSPDFDDQAVKLALLERANTLSFLRFASFS